MPPQPKSPAFQPCPWNVQDWSGTEDSSDTCPDATASSAQEPFAHSFALAQVRLPHQVRPPTTAPTLPQPNNSPNPPADPNTPIPWPKPKPPPPQHLLSNAGSMLPPLPAGPRLAQHQFFAVPMQSFCSRYQNRTCRRQCALHMSALQRAHAHVFALHGLPAQALMPLVVQARHLFGLSNILACIWAHISPQDRRSFHVVDWWSAADARWYLAGLPMPDSDDYSDQGSSSGTSTAASVGA